MRSPPLSGATVWDWADHASIYPGATSYAAPWSLDFASLSEGKNYLSVKLYDGATNYEVLTDAFFVLKDTTPPSITKGGWNENAWYAAAPGVDVDFADAAS